MKRMEKLYPENDTGIFSSLQNYICFFIKRTFIYKMNMTQTLQKKRYIRGLTFSCKGKEKNNILFMRK